MNCAKFTLVLFGTRRKYEMKMIITSSSASQLQQMSLEIRTLLISFNCLVFFLSLWFHLSHRELDLFIEKSKLQFLSRRHSGSRRQKLRHVIPSLAAVTAYRERIIRER